MASDVEICNYALSYIGSSNVIQSLTEASDEARTCTLHLQRVKDLVCRQYPWQFARKVAALALIQNNPNDEWGYEYSYPSDCIRADWMVLGVAGSAAVYAGQSRSRRSAYSVPYQLAYGTSGRVIWTDQDEAILAYNVRITDAARFPEDVVEALAWGMAVAISPTLSRSASLSSTSKANYRSALFQAMATEQNETADDRPAEAEHIRARSVGSDFSGQGGDWQPYTSGFGIS